MISQESEAETVSSFDELEEIESLIAKRHGFYISRDDPILIQYTMNKIILEQNIKRFSGALKAFKEEMALEAQKWGNLSNETADHFLQLIIKRQENSMNSVMEDFRLKIKNEIESSRTIDQSNGRALYRPLKATVSINLFASLLTLLAALLIVSL